MLLVITLLMNAGAIYCATACASDHLVRAPMDRSLAVAAAAPPARQPAVAPAPVKAEVRNFSFHYGAKQALKNITMPVEAGAVTALIGPSGCGKSTSCAPSTGCTT